MRFDTGKTKKARSAIHAFLIVNVIFLIGGPCIIYPVLRVNNHKGEVERVISSYTEDTQVPVYLMTCSASVMSLNGILGILSAYFDMPFLLDSHEGFTLISFGLNLIAAVAASLIPTRPYKDKYESLFQAETYHLLQHPKFLSICKEKHMWNRIQESLSCCGVLGPRDWLFSPLQAIPISCCKNPTSKAECLDLVGLDNNLSNIPFHHVKQNIFPFLWERNCLDTFQDLTARRKLTWTMFPLCLLLLESFLMAYSAQLVGFIRHYTDYISKRQQTDLQHHSTMLLRLKREQVELHMIESKMDSLDANLEETRELRRFSDAP